MFFSVITKNFNWKILIENLLLLKDGMGLRMKIFNMNVYWKIWFLGGGFIKNQ